MLLSRTVRSRLLAPLALLPGLVLGLLLGLVVSSTLVTACGPPPPTVTKPTARPPLPGELPDEQTFLAEVVRDRGVRDMFLPIVDPELVGVDDDHGIGPGEMVVAVDLGSARVCYPTHLLNEHEIVEHTLDGIALLATW